MTKNRGNLQRYAMLFGTYLGVFWILKFTLFPLGLTVPFLLFLFVGMTLCVPFMAYYYTRMYRNQACGGSITFLHAWIFTTFMYMFAALLTAAAHYIYFRYIDQGFILDTYESMLTGYESGILPGMETYINQMKEALSMIRSLSAIEITMQLVSQNVFYGSLLAVPTALFAMRRRPTDQAED